MDIPIELKHLQTLLALRKTGSLTRAAAAMQLTQSALSHQIKQLEEHYNVTLFMRKTSPVKFTLAGERLLHLAEIVLNAMEEANRDLYKLALGKQGALRITLECHTCYGWLLPVMDEFRKKWSEVEIDILPGFQPDPIGLLLQDRADVAIVDETEQTDLGSCIEEAPIPKEITIAAKKLLLIFTPVRMLAAHNMAETNITMPFLSVLSTINPASTLNKSPNIKGSADIQPTFAHEKPRSVFKYVGSQVTTPHDSMELEEKTANKIQKLELHRYTLARSTTEINS